MSSAAYQFLLRLPRYDKRGAASLKPGFERINQLLALVGNPHLAYPVAHVAGTNGKGSTCSMLAAICTAAGLRTGLQTSPHLFDVTERMRVDGHAAPAWWLSDAVKKLRAPIERIGPSFFEATTALSFLYFAERNVDVAIVEVGLGGRLDATNVVRPTVCAITTIGLDHVAILGNDLPTIAREKAGIIKDGIPVFTSNTDPEVVAVLQSVAESRNAPFATVAQYFEKASVQSGGAQLTIELRTHLHAYGTIELDLAGEHQLGNAAVAVAAAETLIKDPTESVRRGLAETRRLSGLRGRLEMIHTRPLVLADVAHNASGVATALEYARGRCTGDLHVGIGLLRDKDYGQIAEVVGKRAQVAHVIPLSGDRALDSGVLEKTLKDRGAALGRAGTAMEVYERFLRTAKADDALLLVGSHQIVGQMDRNLLEKGHDRQNRQG